MAVYVLKQIEKDGQLQYVITDTYGSIVEVIGIGLKKMVDLLNEAYDEGYREGHDDGMIKGGCYY